MGLEPQVWAEWNANRGGEINWEGYNGWWGTHAGTHAHTPHQRLLDQPFSMVQLSEHLQGKFTSSRQQIGQLPPWISQEQSVSTPCIQWRLKVLQWKHWEPCQISLQKTLPADKPYLHKTSSQCCSASPKNKWQRHLRKAKPLKEID